METDETKIVNGVTITARDLPGRPGEGGCYRHYEISGDDRRFDSLEDAEAAANAIVPPTPKSVKSPKVKQAATVDAAAVVDAASDIISTPAAETVKQVK